MVFETSQISEKIESDEWGICEVMNLALTKLPKRNQINWN